MSAFSPGTKHQVLLVDDDDDIRDAVEMMLSTEDIVLLRRRAWRTHTSESETDFGRVSYCSIFTCRASTAGRSSIASALRRD